MVEESAWAAQLGCDGITFCQAKIEQTAGFADSEVIHDLWNACSGLGDYHKECSTFCLQTKCILLGLLVAVPELCDPPKTLRKSGLNSNPFLGNNISTSKRTPM